MKKIAVIILVLFGYTTAGWGIVADRLTTSDPKAGLSGAVYSDLSYADGNVELLTWGVGGAVSYFTLFDGKPAVQRGFNFRFDHFQGRSFGNLFSESWFGSTSYIYMLSPKAGFFAYVQYEANEFQAVDRRITTGIGFAYNVIRGNNFSMGTSLSPMYENESNFIEGDADLLRAAFSFFVKYVADEKKWAVQNSTYVQPKVDEWADYRMLNATELQLSMTKKLYFSFLLEFAFDNQPPASIKDLDTRIKNGFNFKF